MVKNLSALRDKKNLSQRALGELVGMSQQSINAYENSSIEPDIATLCNLADSLEVSVDYLIGHTDILHRYENLTACDLNDAELEFLELYRSLPLNVRKKFTDLMAEYHNDSGK